MTGQREDTSGRFRRLWRWWNGISERERIALILAYGGWVTALSLLLNDLTGHC